MNHMFLEDKVAVVTGSGRGIGEAIARRLAEFGAKLVVTDINLDSARKVANDICANGGKAEAVFFDVADFDNIEEKVHGINDIFNRIDIWVNNAGITGSLPIEEITQESWDRMINIDLKSVFFCTQAVFKIMKKQNYGRLVHVSSLAALRGGRSSDASYAAAKAGVVALSKCFALHGAAYNITSNAICPGNIITPMGKTLSWSKQDPRAYIPLGRYGTAEDIANAVLFFASDLSSYITGDTMNISGGLYM
ncbi:MAG: SDR family oxidoreductase [Clostridiaceae bacterium]|jgi:3-oxoacyl-[acyl-carrier protein] reductase|nr:SDR family oxidoreductase [Clostridiaceae bacterium]